MDELEKAAMTQSLHFLCTHTVNQPVIVIILISKGILLISLKDEIINDRTTQYVQNSKIYDHITRRTTTWATLLEILGESGNSHIVKHLTEKLASLKSPASATPPPLSTPEATQPPKPSTSFTYGNLPSNLTLVPLPREPNFQPIAKNVSLKDSSPTSIPIGFIADTPTTSTKPQATSIDLESSFEQLTIQEPQVNVSTIVTNSVADVATELLKREKLENATPSPQNQEFSHLANKINELRAQSEEMTLDPILMESITEAMGADKNLEWKFKKLILHLSPQTPIKIIRNFLTSQETLEKLTMTFDLPTNKKDGSAVDHLINQFIYQKKLMIDCEWFFPNSLKNLKILTIMITSQDLNCQIENGIFWLQLTLTSILKNLLVIKSMQYLDDKYKDTFKISDGWYEQVTGHRKGQPLTGTDLNCEFYFGKFYQLIGCQFSDYNYFKTLFSKQVQKIGKYHLDTLKTQMEMAIICENLGKFDEAINLFHDIYLSKKKSNACQQSLLRTAKVIELLCQRRQSAKFNSQLNYHEKVRCDGCGCHPIPNRYFKCIFCKDFDFCELCHILKPHQHQNFWNVSFIQSVHLRDHLTLTVKSDKVIWKNGASQMSHGGLVGGHYNGVQELIIARTFFEKDLTPGITVKGDNLCWVTWVGKLFATHEYEVLSLTPAQISWRQSKDGKKVAGGVIGGHTEEGEFLYIGRVKYGESLLCGTIHPSHGCLYFAYEGQELSSSVYEILILNDNF